METLDELVPYRALSSELTYHHADLKVDARVREGIEQEHRLFPRDPAFQILEDPPRNLEGNTLHMLEVGFVAHPDANSHPERGMWQVVILHAGRGERRIRDGNEIAAGEGLDRRVSRPNVGHPTLLSGAELHVVSGPHLPRQDDLYAGEEISERVLQRQRDRQATDAEGGDQRSNVDPEVLQDDEQPENRDCALSEVHDKRRRSNGPFRRRGHRLHRTFRQAHAPDRHRADQRDDDHVRENRNYPRRFVSQRASQVHARRGKPNGRKPSDRGNQQIVPRELRLEGERLETGHHEALDQIAQDESAEDED